MIKNEKIWILCDKGKTGSLNQAVALADSMNLKYEIYFVEKSFKTIFHCLSKLKINPLPDVLKPPFPRLVIGIGRQCIAPMMYLKKYTRTIFIQDPKVSPKNFTAVVAPVHDNLKGDNVVSVVGALNKISKELLDAYPKSFKSHKKILGVFIGGNSKHVIYTDLMIDDLCAQLIKLYEDGYDLLITPSRRTKEEHVQKIRDKLSGKALHMWDLTSENPYYDYLASADALIVTTDSISMMSELCSSGKPTYLFDIDIKKKKFKNFIAHLLEEGYAHHLTKDFSIKETKTLKQMELCITKLQDLLN